jgi:hypothetical protein
VDHFNLLADAAVLAPTVGLACVAEHLLMARPHSLPRTSAGLIGRYAVGAGTVALALTAHALKRPQATARDTAALAWLLLIVAGAATAASHAAADAVCAVRAAERRRVYAEERSNGDQIPAPFRRRD